MVASVRRRQRPRGSIEQLPSGRLRVKVYAGTDPISKRRRYLTETIPDGPNSVKRAEDAVSRLRARVEQKVHARTTATLDQLIDKWMDDVLDVEPITRRTYESMLRKHIRPLMGSLQVGRIDAEVIDSFYAELRRCRDHCEGRRRIDHRTSGDHDCDERCRKHACRGLSQSSRRQVHWILSGLLTTAVRWRWIAVNPIDQTEPPSLPPANPSPPSADEAAAIVKEAWTRDPAWGTFIWLAMTLGARRGEICALHWSDIDLEGGLVLLRRSLTTNNAGELVEKSTKTHQQRRIVMDPQTVEVVSEHLQFCRDRAQTIGVELVPDAYVFSADPDGGRPTAPGSVSHRYHRMVRVLGIRTTLHKLRHYSATELLAAGVDIRTIAGRLGHGGGGATTLRVYAAWVSEADQRAAKTLSARMPARPRHEPRLAPYEQIAADLRERIVAGETVEIPTARELSATYAVAFDTAQRALRKIELCGLIVLRRGLRPVLAGRREL